MSDAITRIQLTQQSMVREILLVLRQKYQSAQWQELASQLHRLARMAEHGGQRLICLQAQSVWELLGRQGGGRNEDPGSRLAEHMETLFAQLAHWIWSLDDGSPKSTEAAAWPPSAPSPTKSNRELRAH